MNPPRANSRNNAWLSPTRLGPPPTLRICKQNARAPTLNMTARGDPNFESPRTFPSRPSSTLRERHGVELRGCLASCVCRHNSLALSQTSLVRQRVGSYRSADIRSARRFSTQSPPRADRASLLAISATGQIRRRMVGPHSFIRLVAELHRAICHCKAAIRTRCKRV